MGTEGSIAHVVRINESGAVVYQADIDGGTNLDNAGHAVEQAIFHRALTPFLLLQLGEPTGLC